MTTIPTDPEAMISRGLWMGMAYLKATDRDVGSLLQTLASPDLPKAARNHVRAEMTIYYLSKWRKIVDPVLREQCSTSPTGAISAMKQQLEEGALSALTMVSRRKQLLGTYRRYLSGETKGSLWSRVFAREPEALFWSRIRQCGFGKNIAWVKMELDRFEKVVIDGTVIAVLLDSLTVSQEEVERDHQSLLASCERRHG